jgi:hypothetical protein
VAASDLDWYRPRSTLFRARRMPPRASSTLTRSGSDLTSHTCFPHACTMYGYPQELSTASVKASASHPTPRANVGSAEHPASPVSCPFNGPSRLHRRVPDPHRSRTRVGGNRARRIQGGGQAAAGHPPQVQKSRSAGASYGSPAARQSATAANGPNENSRGRE